MSLPVNELTPYISFIAPPLIGAFIGYLTNRVAIRMLFRPLKQWRLGPIKIPMTPGAIPSKRHDLAVNIGEMVGEHLLTSNEINNSLKKQQFQEHLYTLIEAKVGSFMKKDLGPLQSLVSPDYRSYFDIARKTITYQIKETVTDYLSTEHCSETLEHAVESWLDELFSIQLHEVATPQLRKTIYQSLDRQLLRILHAETTQNWVEDYIYRKIIESADNEKRLRDLLPQSMIESIIETIDRQTPYLLAQGVKILEDPLVRQKVVDEIVTAIDEFIDTLGPMSSMIRNFLDMTMVEEKIKEYFLEKQDQIAELITAEAVRAKVSQTLTRRARRLFNTSVKTIIEHQSIAQLQSFSSEATALVFSGLRSPQAASVFDDLFSNHLEKLIDERSCSVGRIIEEVFGENGTERSKAWVAEELKQALKSPRTKSVIDHILENMIDQLLKKPIGRLADLVPAGVRDGLYKSLQEMATKMLTSEVPGVVKSLNIRKIVTDRIDSFDLLRLERLLLSIMEEQFKYINIFGGLLGFLIGCMNIVFLTDVFR
ncbi:MAG: DUF445 family protein [Desulfocapsaceae bacterium]|jgi:uncharacterized membrane protein YheB (UPF0754 family)|nr:DUF445 family protein [Desulfocapsaceae bacterium]